MSGAFSLPGYEGGGDCEWSSTKAHGTKLSPPPSRHIVPPSPRDREIRDVDGGDQGKRDSALGSEPRLQPLPVLAHPQRKAPPEVSNVHRGVAVPLC